MENGVREGWALEEPVDEQADEPHFASRVSRLFGAVVDGFFFLAFAAAAMLALYVMPIEVTPRAFFATYLGIMGLWALINVFLLVESGQTIGKSLVGLRIERANGDKAGFLHLVVLRYGVMMVMGTFLGWALGTGASHLFWLLDALFIFGATQRCGHDLIADTRVVEG